jgi:hypothetical protein
MPVGGTTAGGEQPRSCARARDQAAIQPVPRPWASVGGRARCCRSPSGRRRARAEQSRLTHFMVSPAGFGRLRRFGARVLGYPTMGDVFKGHRKISCLAFDDLVAG